MNKLAIVKVSNTEPETIGLAEQYQALVLIDERKGLVLLGL